MNEQVQPDAFKWRQIVDGATDTAIISTNRDGEVTSWNLGAEQILGWTEEEMIGLTLDRVFTAEGQESREFAREIEDAISKGRGGGEEGWRVRKDGSRFWAVGELTPIRTRDGAIVGFTKILRDRTKQRQAEEEVRQDRRTLEVLNRAASALALETDRHRVVQIVTDAGVELTGAQFGAFFYNVVTESGERYQLYTVSGAPLEAFSKFPMPQNSEVFAPTVVGTAVVRCADITQDPRYGSNTPGRGLPEGQLPVRSYLSVPVISRVGTVLGGLFFGHPSVGVFGERSERALAGLSSEAAIAMDNVELSQAALKEIETRKRAEEALREFNASLEHQVAERTHQLRLNEEALRQSQKMEVVGQLTGGVAHDFNNLLQIIMGNLDTARRGVNDASPRVRRALETAANGARRAASLTQRLLAFSRRQPLNPKPVDVNALISGMSDLLHRTLGEITEVLTVHGAALWRIEADATELESAILNLALNARDAMPDGGRLTIETANADIDRGYSALHAEVLPGEYVAISVSDTGTGMSEDAISRAFEPFFTTKPVGEGTGLGLSQVYGFVKQSGGNVKIYSELGQGTCVKIYLPRLADTTREAAPATESSTPLATAEETILVVEDDDDVRAYSVEILRDLGYRVIEAHDGPSALSLLERQFRVDLLFTDVILPGGMTGAQVAAQARGIKQDLKVLFTTGYARNAIVHHGRLDQGVQLITKPFCMADLATRVREVLDGFAAFVPRP
ncbi:MAG: ATP-binding protein [Steroidobacteraceae bacterium]